MKTNHYQIMFSGIGASLLAALSVAAAAPPPGATSVQLENGGEQQRSDATEHDQKI